MKRKKIKRIFIVNIILAVLSVAFPFRVMEVWDLALLVGILGGIILIEIPYIILTLMSDDKEDEGLEEKSL